MALTLNKDIASVINKYTSPNLYRIYYEYKTKWNNYASICKFFSANCIEQIVDHLFDNRNANKYDWVYLIAFDSNRFALVKCKHTKYGRLYPCEDCSFNDRIVFRKIISRFIQHIDIEWL